MTQRTELQQRIIDTLLEHGPMGSKPLFDKVRIAADRKELAIALHDLDPIVRKQSNSQWSVSKAQLAEEPNAAPVKPEPKPLQAVTPIEKPAVAPAPEVNALEALDRLESRLTGSVSNLELKTQVLQRLSELMDASIAEVLDSIAEDLRGLDSERRAA